MFTPLHGSLAWAGFREILTVADPGFVERGGVCDVGTLEGCGCGRGMGPLPREARKLSATTCVRDQWIMDAIREYCMHLIQVGLLYNDEAMN